MREQHYIVAGHAFCLRMAENEMLWHDLEMAYVPFQQEKTNQRPLFTLTIHELSSEIETVSAEKPLLEQTGVDGNLFRYYQFSDYCQFEDFSPEGELNGIIYVNDDLHDATLYVCSQPVRRKLMADYGMMLMYMLNAISFDTVVMHASVILSAGQGYLLMGKSGTGKSTHCDLWRKYIPGCERLNDDHPVVRIVDNIPMVYGSPWSGKTPCYRNLSAPIGGFIRLWQASHNSIFRLSSLAAYASLSASCSAMTWKSNHADAKDYVIQQLIRRVACWRLECLPDEAAVRLCANTVRKGVLICPS